MDGPEGTSVVIRLTGDDDDAGLFHVAPAPLADPAGTPPGPTRQLARQLKAWRAT